MCIAEMPSHALPCTKKTDRLAPVRPRSAEIRSTQPRCVVDAIRASIPHANMEPCGA
jgi:hypothetical protein